MGKFKFLIRKGGSFYTGDVNDNEKFDFMLVHYPF